MGDPLQVLPAELFVEILGWLGPLVLIRDAAAVSKGWRQIIQTNDLVWKRVATRVLGLPAFAEAATLDELQIVHEWSASSHFHGISTFRHLCTRWQQVLRGWQGALETHEQGEQPYLPQGGALSTHTSSANLRRRLQAKTNFLRVMEPEGQLDLWRIKVDPVEGTLIATTRMGGLYVIDLNTGKTIWKLDGLFVPPYQHLEGAQGIFVMYSTLAAAFEVWVHRRLMPDATNRDLYQLQAQLPINQGARASRFKWPIFCAMGDAGTAFFWDLTDPTQCKALASIDASARHGNRDIRYIDFDDDHFFIVGSEVEAVTVYDRRTGRMKWCFETYLRQPRAAELIRSFEVEYSSLGGFDPTSFDLFEKTLRPSKFDPSLASAIATPDQDPLSRRNFPIWTAIHPDAETGALVILNGVLALVIPNFAGLTEAKCDVPMLAITYALPHPVAEGSNGSGTPQLAVADGRVFAVAATTLLVDLAPDRERQLTAGSAPFELPDDPGEIPKVRVFAGANPYGDFSDLNGIEGSSCAQMDGANLFAVIPTPAPRYEDSEDVMDDRDALFEALHWRVDGAP